MNRSEMTLQAALDHACASEKAFAEENERLRARVAQLEAPRLFPVCQAGFSIPWSLAERAYEQYSKPHGASQSLETLARRGGFYAEELDQFVPGWREETREINLLRRRLARAEVESTRLRSALLACEEALDTVLGYDQKSEWAEKAIPVVNAALGEARAVLEER